MEQQVVPGTLAKKISVTGGSGTGTTRLTAFDAALQAAGIHNANLIRISSITPTSAETMQPTPRELEEEITPGAYYPAVYTWEASSTSGDLVHAAVAGARLESGYGINIEHHGINEVQDDVQQDCQHMLTEMATRRESPIVDDSVWVHYEPRTVNESDRWHAAVAAILYSG